jgi:hypothetical protein
MLFDFQHVRFWRSKLSQQAQLLNFPNWKVQEGTEKVIEGKYKSSHEELEL